jgi:Fe-S oxidoreductase/nitrate reductase gamma subunit
MNIAGEATREIYWNISHIGIMYALAAIALAIASYGLYGHVRRWRRGLPLRRLDRPLKRLGLLFKHAFIQGRTAREGYPGLFHWLIYGGFVVLTIATTIVALDADFGTRIMRGPCYLYFQSFTVDVCGALVMAGILMAAARRHLSRPDRLVYTRESSLILLVIFLILATGFAVEGWRIAATDDPWGLWSPFGYLVARAFSALMSTAAIKACHRVAWWFHLVLSLGFMAWIPYSKMIHVITAPLNIFLANLEPLGSALKSVDFDSPAGFGVNSLSRFTWKDLLDLDACTECGRCTAACPAHSVGKELSPRDIILQLRDLMHDRPQEVFGAGTPPAPEDGGGSLPPVLPIIGSVPATAPAALWQCTTCAACMEVCPVFIEQMPKILDMRRHLAMEEAEYPATMQEAMTSLESRGHPFRGTQATRADWARDLNLRLIGDHPDAEILFYVGCSGALVERNQKVARATAQLLQKAGVNFAILGRSEKCCGDPARRIGNEFLFETLAKANIADLNKYRVKQVVTACPHCLNTLRNEYPRYGGHFEVYHHSEYLARLLGEGRLAAPSASGNKITFHDPCYLGRQNGIYADPRKLVQISSRYPLLEMARSRANSFCCGGGGGGSFIEEAPGQRINRERASEAVATGADTLAVACPFCMTMLEDGVNAAKGEQDVRVMDIAEVLLQGSTHSTEEL